MTKKRFLSTFLVATVLAASPLTARSGQPFGPPPYDLTAEIEGSPQPVGPGEQLTLTITVTNNGAGEADPVLIQIETPVGTTFASVSSTNGLSTHPDVGAFGAVETTARSLESGVFVVVELVVDVDAGVEPGSVLEALVAAVGPNDESAEANPGDNTATTAIPVGMPRYDLTAVIEGSPQPVGPGEQLTLTITVTNNGAGEADPVLIQIETPVRTTFASVTSTNGLSTHPDVGASGAVETTARSLESGDSVVVELVVDVDAEVEPGSVLEALGAAVGPNDESAEANPGDNTATTAIPVRVAGESVDLALDIEVFGDEAGTDSPFDFDVVVTNLSEDTTVVGVVVTTGTPNGTTFSDAGAFGEISSPEPGDRGNILCTFEAIEPGESEVLSVTVDVIGAPGLDIDFEATVVSSSEDPNPDDNSAAVSVPIVESDEFTLDWDEPDFDSGVALPPPRNLVIIEGAAAKAFVDRVSGASRPASPRTTLVGYKIYRATRPGETPSPGNFYQSVPATVTSTTSPAAPAGTFFVVTAQYEEGESGASNEASAEVPAADLTSVKVKSSKIVADGTGFSATVQVFVDGIPFATAAKLKKGGTRVVQKDSLLTGVSLATYLGGHPSVLITFRNENGGVAAYRHPQ